MMSYVPWHMLGRYIGCAMMLPIVLAAQSAHDMTLSDAAQQQHAVGNYAGALASYAMITHKTAAIYYALGSCCMHLGDTIGARDAWRRALLGASPRLATTINRSLALLELGEGQIVSWSMSALLYRLMAKSFEYMPIVVWQWVLIGSWYMLCMVWFGMQRSLLWRLLIGAIVMLFIIPAAVVVAEYYVYTRYEHAIVRDDYPLYAGPCAQYRVIGTVARNAECVVYNHTSGFSKIAVHDMVGWIAQDGLSTCYDNRQSIAT